MLICEFIHQEILEAICVENAREGKLAVRGNVTYLVCGMCISWVTHKTPEGSSPKTVVSL